MNGIEVCKSSRFGRTSSNRGLYVLACLAVAVVTISSTAGEENRLEMLASLVESPAEWISADGAMVAYGSGSRWKLARKGLEITTSGDLPFSTSSAVLVRDRLYAATRGSVRVVDVTIPDAVDTRLALTLPPDAELRLTRSRDYLVVLEQGVGLHVVTLPPPVGFKPPPERAAHHHWPDEPMVVGFLPFAQRAVSIAASGARVYVATAGGGLQMIDLGDPHRPRLDRAIEMPFELRGLAANGDRVFMLTDTELRVFDVSRNPNGELLTVYDGVHGSGLEVSGRVLHVAGGDDGLGTYRERSTAAVTHIVTLSGFEFTPSDIVIAVNDTVEWQNNSGFHDTDSCNVGEIGCTSNSTEVFDSGAPATAPWTYQHTFLLVGPNPYTCTVHAGFGMLGSVTAEGGGQAPPPAVPDGETATTPLTVTKLDIGGASLEVAFDDSSCTDVGDTQIVGGRSADLPGQPGEPFGITTSSCNCGTVSPCTWNTAPDPVPGDMIWFLMLATDASTTEGSWGTGSTGSERSGPGADGNSQQCGVTTKDVTNSCGI